MGENIDRRGFLGGIAGSIAAACGWKPKGAEKAPIGVEFKAGHLAGIDHFHARARSLLPSRYPPYTSEDHVRFYNRAAETACPVYAAGYQLVADDPFATFVIDATPGGVS